MSIFKKALAIGASVVLMATAAEAEEYEFGGIEPENIRLERSSFEPIAQVAAAKRVVRRISWRDPFGSLYAPSVTLEKTPSGEVTFTVTGNYGKIKETGTITGEQWADILASEQALAPPPRNQRISNELCHSNRLVIETSDADGKSRRRDASICGGPGDTNALLYTYKVADAVVLTMDKCARFAAKTRDPWWSLQNCVSPPRRRGADQDQ
jgi:hypothetical protein